MIPPSPPLTALTTTVFVSISKTVQFKDSLSAAIGDGFNICSPRNYQIFSTPDNAGVTALSNSELTIDATTGLVTVYTINSATLGSHTATVIASLVNYPSITATTTFTITINACIVTSFTMAALSPSFD